MRHGTSELNEKMRDFRGEATGKDRKSLMRSGDSSTRENYYSLIFDPANVDARLSQKGIDEVLKQRALIRSLNIGHIIVSPMRRAVETAILSTIGLHQNITITLLPVLREEITFKNTTCSSVKEIRAFISRLESRLSNPDDEEKIIVPLIDGLTDMKSPDYKVDFSQIEGDDLWFLRMLRNEAIRDQLIGEAHMAIDSQRPVFDQLKDFLTRVELERNPLWRDRLATNETKDELKQRLFDENGVQV
jgi:hypothetical protein